jgi:hypothetical protein
MIHEMDYINKNNNDKKGGIVLADHQFFINFEQKSYVTGHYVFLIFTNAFNIQQATIVHC